MEVVPYIGCMARFTHPRLEDVPLDLALHALADPNRLAMVARLAATERSAAPMPLRANLSRRARCPTI